MTRWQEGLNGHTEKGGASQPALEEGILLTKLGSVGQKTKNHDTDIN